MAYAQYQLTDGFPDYDDYFEVQQATETFQPQGEPVRIDRGLRGSLALRRYQSLSRRVGLLGTDDGAAGFISQILKGVGGGVLREQGWQRAIVRVRRRATQAMDSSQQRQAADPNDASYFSTVYEANVWFDGDEVLYSKRDASNQSAPASGTTKPMTTPASGLPATGGQP